MAIKFNRSQTFATNGTVTAAGLHNLVDGTDIYQALITDQTAMTSVGSLDKLLIADSDLTAADAPRSVTVNELFEDALTLSTYTNIKATNATITTGTVATLNSTTATIPTLTSITKITSGTGTAAAPAISPTGDTNTGIFFPAADTIALAEGGAEAMRIDSSGNVGIGTTNPAYRLNVQSVTASGLNKDFVVRVGDETNFYRQSLVYNNSASTAGAFPAQSAGLYWEHGGGYGASGGLVIATNSANAGPVILATADTERLRIDSSGNVGIGTVSPVSKLNVYDAASATLTMSGDNVAQTIINRASTDASAPRISLRKSRGLIASPAAVATSDNIGDLFFQAFGGTTNRNVAIIRSSVEAYVSDSDISSNLVFLTSTAGGATATEKFRIGSAGQIGIGGATYGTNGQVLTSSGSASAPSWTTISATPGTNSVTFPTLSTSTTEADNVASRVAKAWVNWNGTGTVAIRASFNVSSVTDITTGQYKANFTVAMSDVNYTALYSGGEAIGVETRSHNNILNQTTTGVTVYCVSPDANYRDTDPANVVVFK